jgi:hypothetical protein
MRVCAYPYRPNTYKPPLSIHSFNNNRPTQTTYIISRIRQPHRTHTPARKYNRSGRLASLMHVSCSRSLKNTNVCVLSPDGYMHAVVINVRCQTSTHVPICMNSQVQPQLQYEYPRRCSDHRDCIDACGRHACSTRIVSTNTYRYKTQIQNISSLDIDSLDHQLKHRLFLTKKNKKQSSTNL